MLKKTPSLILVIFIIAMSLRFVLAFLNREANDNHIEVVNWILSKHQLPEVNDCAECFMPKLFYVFSAGIISWLDLKSTAQKIIAVQLINVVLSFFILVIFWKFIRKQTVNETIKISTFAFFALNPCLMAINIQATNDTLEIFAGVSAIYFVDSFFRETKIRDGTLMIIAISIAALTKGTGMLLFTIILFVFILKIFSQNTGKKKYALTKYFLILLITFCSIIPFAGGYYTNYKKFNNLSLGSVNHGPPLSFFKPDYILRPGLTDIFHGWLTFRYFDMIKQPYINNEKDDYPLHRTSLWSQLYGRTMFLHFDQWPPSWQTEDDLIVNVGRILILLGIVPLILFLRGLVHNSFLFIKNFFKNRKTYLATSNDYLHLAVTFGFLASSLIYSYFCRDFSAMKSIYIFPGLISFIKLFIEGFSFIKLIPLLKAVNFTLIAISVLSVFDIGYLIYQHYEYYYF